MSKWTVSLLQDGPDFQKMLEKVFKRARKDGMKLVAFDDEPWASLPRNLPMEVAGTYVEHAGSVSTMVFEKE